MIEATRRRFFAFMSASPLAARRMTSELIATQAGINTTGIGSMFYGMPQGRPAKGGEVGGELSWTDKIIRASNWAKVVGIPDVVEEELREHARNVQSLDHDIANKCWSMAVKVQTQRQRNYERAIKWMYLQSSRKQKFRALKAVLGFEWPWS